MPNLFAYVVLLSFPLVAILLFRHLPLRLALIWVIFGGYMVLPQRAGFNLPVLPTFDKELLPSLMALLLAFAALHEARRRARRRETGGVAQTSARAVSQDGFVSARARPVEDPRTALLGEPAPPTWRRSGISALLAICFISPILTMLANPEPLFYGPRIIPGLDIIDAWNAVQAAFVMLIPFIIGRKFLATETSHDLILRVMCHMALGMSLAILIEVRMSPQLNVWIYGFQGSSFAQHIRAGGYRPMLFLEHGLWVGIIISMSVVSALALAKSRAGKARLAWSAIAGWLFITLVLSKTIGALALCILLGGGVLLLPRRSQLLMAGFFAGAAAIYPLLRSSDLVPVMEIYEIARSYSEDRASSFMFRLTNEDQLLERAAEKRLTGWGGWGRPSIFDPQTGEQTSVADGSWIIVMGMQGWIGYIATFGLLCLPTVMLTLRKGREVTVVTVGLVVVLVVNIIDLIPNATLTPITWLLAGAVAGFFERAPRLSAADPAVQPTREKSAVLAPAGVRRSPG